MGFASIVVARTLGPQGQGVVAGQGAQLGRLRSEEAERSAKVAEEALQFHDGNRGSV